MSGGGWIPAWRKLFEGHELSPDKRDPACRAYAWLDLCQLAQHDIHRHAGITLHRGEALVAVRGLAKRWGWSKSRVSRFMVGLESRNMIGTVSGTPNGTVYRIVNYDLYAKPGNVERDISRDTERDSSGTAAGQEQQLEPHNQLLPSLRSGSAPKANGVPNGDAWNGAVILAMYVDFCRAKGWPDPPRSRMGKLGAAGARLSENPKQTVISAMVGMDTLFPYSKGEPWDLMDLEKKLTKAAAAASTHPRIQEEVFRAAFLRGIV